MPPPPSGFLAAVRAWPVRAGGAYANGETQANLATPVFRLGHRRGLDGLRGAAVLTVLADHIGWLGDGFGFVAVNTFFVLSGFLITSLLVAEWQATGTIQFARFYARRALRLLPALVAMLLAFTIYAVLTQTGVERTEYLRQAGWALCYFTNCAKAYQFGPTLELAHTWSLSLEEQFYFCWPWLLLFLLKRNTPGSLLCWLALGITLAVATRTALFLGDPRITLNNTDRVSVMLDVRADALLMGCGLAVMAAFNQLEGWERWTPGLTALAGVSVLGLIGLSHVRPMAPWMVYAGWLGASLFAAAIILHIVVGSGSWLHRLWENRVLVYCGQISYSLYIWHFTILRAIHHYHPSWPRAFNLIPVFAATLGSYYLLERPCLRLKSRFQAVR